MPAHVIEIARQEGAEFRSVRLTVEDDGTIKMDAQDIGPKVGEIWGDDEYEFWVHVPPTALPKLAFELLREKFAGQLGARAPRVKRPAYLDIGSSSTTQLAQILLDVLLSSRRSQPGLQ